MRAECYVLLFTFLVACHRERFLVTHELPLRIALPVYMLAYEFRWEVASFNYYRECESWVIFVCVRKAIVDRLIIFGCVRNTAVDL
jgi:hypothetical protein